MSRANRYIGAKGWETEKGDRKISVTFPEPLFHEVKKIASENDRSCAHVIRRLVYLGLVHIQVLRQEADDEIIKD